MNHIHTNSLTINETRRYEETRKHPFMDFLVILSCNVHKKTTITKITAVYAPMAVKQREMGKEFYGKFDKVH